MIIILSDLQKEHLKLLHDYSVEVVLDFCKLAIDYIYNGVNSKKCSIAAEKLNKNQQEVENVIYALIFVMVEGCKQNISDVDFKSSLAFAGFSHEHQDVLTQLYIKKHNEISKCLYLMQHKDATYQDLAWRFEVEIDSKDGIEKIKPYVTFNLVLNQTKSACDKDTIEKTNNYHKISHSNLNSHVINTSIESAQTASQCQNVVSHNILQCDLPNLLNVTQKLEQALKELKSQHVRKVQRALT